MSDFRSKPGSFLPFMEARQRRREMEQAEPVMSAALSMALSPLGLLDILARQVARTLPLPDLETLSHMDAMRFRNALRSLRDAGYVAIQGPPLEEMVQLTDKGAEAAALAHPQ